MLPKFQKTMREIEKILLLLFGVEISKPVLFLGHDGAKDADNREATFPWKHHPGHRRGLLRRGEANDTV